MPEQEKKPTALQRAAALRLIRENIFYGSPGKYSVTDIAEDLPGRLRPLGSLLSDVLPSASIISRDPEKRRQQIQEALDRIKSTTHSSEGLGKEILGNVAGLGAGSAATGFALAALLKTIGLRNPVVLNKLKNRTGGLFGYGVNFRSPTTLRENLKQMSKGKLTQNPAFRKMLAESGHEAAIGGAIGATHGALYPLLANITPIPEAAFSEAAKTLQENPTLTSLPAGELLSSVDSTKTNNKFTNMGLGAALGASSGAISGAVPGALKLLWRGLSNAIARKKTGFSSPILNEIKRDALHTGGYGAALGALTGALTNNSPEQNAG